MTQPAQRYLVAELATLADELRNPRTPLSRSQLADLADRAWRDATFLASGADMPAGRYGKPYNASNGDAHAMPEGGATIIPLFGRV